MNAILRTTLIGAASLFLMAMPATAQSKKGATVDTSALHLAQKNLAVVEANIRAVQLRMDMVQKEIIGFEAMYTETGKPEYKDMIERSSLLLARLQRQLDNLNAMAKALRDKVRELSSPPAPPLSGGWTPESIVDAGVSGNASLQAPGKSSSKKGK